MALAAASPTPSTLAHLPLLARTALLEELIVGEVRQGGVLPRLHALETEVTLRGQRLARAQGVKPRLDALEGLLQALKEIPTGAHRAREAAALQAARAAAAPTEVAIARAAAATAEAAAAAPAGTKEPANSSALPGPEALSAQVASTEPVPQPIVVSEGQGQQQQEQQLGPVQSVVDKDELQDDSDSNATDPEMPELERVISSHFPDTPPATPRGSMKWDVLPAEAFSMRVRPSPEQLSDDEAAAEAALCKAEELLGKIEEDADGDALDDDSRFERAVELLHQAASEGARSTLEGAVDMLLTLFRSVKTHLRSVVHALAACQGFPTDRAAKAARYLMLRPEWPNRDDKVRDLCEHVARASPLEVVTACLDLVPRHHSPEMLGFSWLLDPLSEELMVKFQVGDRILALEDMTTDSRQGVSLKKGTDGEIRDIDEDGDLSVRFRDVEKRQWVFSRHSYRIALKNGKNEGLCCAVTLLCDDAGGPPLCAASARALLMRYAEEVGMPALQRQSQDEALALKSRKAKVRETLKKLRDYQNVSASE